MFKLTIELIIFLFPLAYSPGPGNLFFAANGARFGFVKTLHANIGYHLATWLVTALIGLSLFNIANEFDYFFNIIGYLGSAYVFYLAWCFSRAGSTNKQTNVKPVSFWSGAILLLLNPKAYFIIALMFSQFLTSDSRLFDILWITTIFTLNNLIAFCLWAYLGDKLLSAFRSDKEAKRLNLLFGSVLALVATWLLISHLSS